MEVPMQGKAPIYISSPSLSQETNLKNITVRILSMEGFYSRWLVEEQGLLNDLLSVPEDRPDLHIPLLSRVLSHFGEYYTHKSEVAERDIFQVLSPNWMTAVERSFLWLGGLKSCVIFCLVPLDLTIDQAMKFEELKQITDKEERELERRMRMAEEALATLLALEAEHGDYRNGEARGEAEERVVDLMHTVYIEADRLRWRIVKRSMEILSTAQAVRFFAGIVQFHLQTHRSGLQ